MKTSDHAEEILETLWVRTQEEKEVLEMYKSPFLICRHTSLLELHRHY